jgi:hypothetical protein
MLPRRRGEAVPARTLSSSCSARSARSSVRLQVPRSSPSRVLSNRSSGRRCRTRWHRRKSRRRAGKIAGQDAQLPVHGAGRAVPHLRDQGAELVLDEGVYLTLGRGEREHLPEMLVEPGVRAEVGKRAGAPGGDSSPDAAAGTETRTPATLSRRSSSRRYIPSVVSNDSVRKSSCPVASGPGRADGARPSGAGLSKESSSPGGTLRTWHNLSRR